MSNIAVSNDWPAGVYQYADGDVLDGGADSSEVLPLKQLANRSLFQRLANVTPWDSALAAEFGYPNKAVVMHGGLSWRALVANAVEPGTDVTKWERWGYSESELAELLADISLNFSGPQTLTEAEREQAHENLALPVEFISFFDGDSVTVPTGGVGAKMTLAGCTVVQAGDITTLGDNVVIAKAGVYGISACCWMVSLDAGIFSGPLSVEINGATTSLIEAPSVDHFTTPYAGMGRRVNLAGFARLVPGDTVALRQVQQNTRLSENIIGFIVTRLAF
ncbi:MAG: hypothetical protein K0M67_16530 [Thiobacillus sp.]|nr:hypothetical protein [Thiobacillus sp.]